MPDTARDTAPRWAARALRDGHPDTRISAAALTVLLDEHHLTPTPGSALAALLDTLDPDRDPLADDLRHHLAATSTAPDLDTLVAVFETLVPGTDATVNGATYTPAAITRFMAAHALDTLAATGHDLTQVRILDPAAGAGALLVAALLETTARTGEPAHLVAARLTGIDIDTAALDRARLLIETATLLTGDTRVPHPHLRTGDALAATAPFPAGHADLVIANPPYVRYQTLPEDVRADLAARYTTCADGNFNLYFAFFHTAHTALADGGVTALITPNGYFTSRSGAPLRAWLTDTGMLDHLVDFGHHRVFAASTYTAIAFGTRRPPPTSPPVIGYTRVTGLDGLAALPRTWPSHAARIPLPSGTSPWAMVPGTLTTTVRAATATPRTLGDIVDIRFGVATLRDRLYHLPGERDEHDRYLARYGGRTWPIEAGLTRRCVRVTGIADQAALDADPGRILYPYRITAETVEILDEATLAGTYPLGYAYLTAIRADLAARDHGRKTYPAWYAYGRTQSLRPTGRKLLTPLYADTPRFLRDTDPDRLFINGCGLTLRPGADLSLDQVAAVVNSSVCRDYVTATAPALAGGFHSYQKTHIASLGIPAADHPGWADVAAASTPADRDTAVRALYGL